MPMSLRPNSPMQRGNRHRMMHQRYNGGMPFQNFNHPPQMAAPMVRRNQGGREGGGLLAKILGRGKQQGGFQGAVSSMNRASTSSGGGILNSLTNPEALSGFLNNTQSFLKTAQQLGPMFQQYGPLVRNLPSLWKLYRGLTDATNENDESKSTQPETDIRDEELVEIDHSIDDDTKQSKKNSTPKVLEESPSNLLKDKRSVPKLYI